MSYIIKRSEDQKYVSKPGSERSYTARLQDARTWGTRADAEREACGNEYVISVADEMRG